MSYRLVMQHFQTPAALAEALTALGRHISPQAIYKWKKKGIPLDRAPQIEVASGGVLRCEAICPQVLWVRSDDGQIIGYSVPLPAPNDPDHRNFQPCRVWLSASVSHTANHKTS